MSILFYFNFINNVFIKLCFYKVENNRFSFFSYFHFFHIFIFLGNYIIYKIEIKTCMHINVV